MSLLIIPAIGVSIARVLDVGWTVQYIGQMVGALIVWGITLLRRRLSYGLRANTILFLLFWLAWTGQVYTPSPTSYVFFVSAASMAVVFYGVGAGVAAVLLSVVVTVSTYFAITAGVFPVPTYATSMSFTTWLSRLASLIVASAGPVIAITQFRRSLVRELQRSEEVSEAKSAFLATMSHELRTPMTAVIGIAELLQHENLTPEQSKKVDRISRSGKNLLSLLNDLLDFAKIEAEQMPIDRVAFSVDHLITDVQGLLTPLAVEKGLALRVENAASRDSLMGDPTRLRQILHNLIGNAIKFTEQGEIIVRVSRSAVSSETVMLSIAVSDTGIGISPSDQSRLFQPFVQAQDFRSRSHGGTGLGLAISRRLAEQMGGSLSLSSELGKGSTFVLTLPLAVSELAADSHAGARDITVATGEPLEVLAAEDNEAIRDLLREMLIRRGHRATVVENGLLAVKAVQSGAFDVIIMDMHMPVMDGVDATRAIRKLASASAGIPIVALTAGLTEDQRHAYLAAGVDQVVAKPAHWPTLFDAIEVRGRGFRDGNQTVADPAPTLTPGEALVSGDIFDAVLFKEIEDALGAEVMRSAIETFRRNIADYLAALKQTLAAGDLASARKIGHAIKGTSFQFGAVEIGRLAAGIELGTASLEEMQRAVAQIPGAMMRFDEALARRSA